MKKRDQHFSNKEEEKPLETTSQKEELPEVVPNTPQEGTHHLQQVKKTSQLALLGLGLLRFVQSYPYKKETRVDPKQKKLPMEFCSKEVFIFIQLIQSLDPFYEGD